MRQTILPRAMRKMTRDGYDNPIDHRAEKREQINKLLRIAIAKRKINRIVILANKLNEINAGT